MQCLDASKLQHEEARWPHPAQKIPRRDASTLKLRGLAAHLPPRGGAGRPDERHRPAGQRHRAAGSAPRTKLPDTDAAHTPTEAVLDFAAKLVSGATVGRGTTTPSFSASSRKIRSACRTGTTFMPTLVEIRWPASIPLGSLGSTRSRVAC